MDLDSFPNSSTKNMTILYKYFGDKCWQAVKSKDNINTTSTGNKINFNRKPGEFSYQLCKGGLEQCTNAGVGESGKLKES